jgi:hypothetical protein
MSGDVGSASGHFDSSSSANVCGSLGMTADYSVAAGFCFETLPKFKGTKPKQ